MSGFEIAGIVLGGFPILIIAVEFFDETFKRVTTWRQFRTDFLQFIDAINFEKQFFNELLRRFLLSVDVPRDEVHLFLEDRSYEGWHREELIAIFHLRLGKSYKGFKSLIKTVDSLMIEVNNLLAFKDGRIDWQEERLSGFEYQVKRVQHSFSKRGPKAFVALEKCNRKLQEILDSVEKLETIGSRKDDLAEAIFFSRIKKHSQSLHKAINDRWSCECISAHEVSIQLQSRTSVDSPIIFNLSFEYPEILKTALYPSDEQLSRTFSKCRKVETTRKARSIIDSILPASPQQLSVAENVRQKLHRNIESKPNSTSNKQASQVKKSGSSDSPSSSIQVSSTVLNEIEIHNLCETVYNFDITCNSYLGYLPADHLERHEFRDSDDSVTSRAFYRDKFVSLETILSKPDKFSPLNRYERYKVAYILASSLLQLQNAPWLTGNLQKRHILFLCDWNKHKILIDQPNFSHSRGPSSPQSANLYL
ncbi:uncharacterized protein EAE98_005877 [Botrytis deweyae]|uniref:Prion-inhibition and propagation HeLo domain-containing protein n=1 Tax=Botrytis deweyae TaxID=2478750 RepID=A0ABQ7IL14_9HELO|nr:uncharacterized protein EAE98_005877 [Botrytis deweyae]KAF7927495.1 hypothetical protein EAE98_005877 [Botrytis deweyae]